MEKGHGAVIKWPGIIESGSTSHKLVALTDVFATLADFTGYDVPWDAGEDSFSFLHELTGETPSEPQREFIVVDATKGLFGIRQGDWKLITGQGGGGPMWQDSQNIRMESHQWHYPTDIENPPGQLYNLKNDPQEQNNLYFQYPKIVAELRGKLREIKFSGRSR